MFHGWLPLFPVLLTLALPVRAAVVPATDLESPYTADSRAHAINSAGQIAIEGSFEFFPYGGAAVLLPPHPGGTVMWLECVEEDCFQEAIGPEDIAPDGRVVGTHYRLRVTWPATWSPTGALTDLVFLYGTSVIPPNAAEGINSSGTIVGTLQEVDGPRYPTRWEDAQASPETLPNDGPYLGPFPKAINDAGIIVGHTDGATPYAAIWIPNGGYQLSSLPLLPSGSHARAKDINDAGQVVGTADDGTAFETAVLWEPLGGGVYLAVALPRLAAGQDCEATGINDIGHAVGRCTDGVGVQRGIVWSVVAPAVLHELEPLPGATELTVRDVNDQGVAVGWSWSSTSDWDTAVLWAYSTEPVPALPGWGSLLLASVLLWTSVRIALARSRSKPPGFG
ncbi:MAG: hypothetical protein JRG80_14655 [Deltaproteobacteria bacterium]|nr:hypothetical protein [Deltaproteobacteria bacterium]